MGRVGARATLAAALSACLGAPAGAALADGEPLPLEGADGEPTEEILEALLAPGEYSDRRFVHESSGEEAAFCLDSGLGATEPFAELHPTRARWPRVAGLDLRPGEEPLRVTPAEGGASDGDLDEGFSIRWTVRAVGQAFKPDPRFDVRVVAAEVISSVDGRTLLSWRAPRPRPACSPDPPAGRPSCALDGLSREVRAAALGPDGSLLALSIGGLRPRLEVYDVSSEPRLVWRALFPASWGGVVETAFSADGDWVVALPGTGAMHRFEARTGGRHMAIPSSGRTARSIPPGRAMAVAGERGEVTLWYLSDGTIAWRLPPRSLRGPVDRLAASGDGRRFATLEYDEERTVVRIWEVRRRAMLAQVEVDPYEVADVALDRRGETLFIAHEEKGLLAVDVEGRAAAPEPLGGEGGSRCRGRLHWIDGAGLLGCSVDRGLILVDGEGEVAAELGADVEATDWIVTAASGGRRLAAVGGGHLLVWWR